MGRLVHSETYVKQNLVIPEDAVKEETSETNDTNSGETSSADEDKNSMNTEDGVEKMMIAYGSMTGSALNRYSKNFSGKNGKYLVFTVKNNGVVDIVARIDDVVDIVSSMNDKDEVLIKPGEKKGIKRAIPNIAPDYEFNATPTPNGGVVDIEYEIYQTNN